MSYTLLPWEGDSVAIPSAVFQKLGTTAKEAYFRVILYILSTKDTAAPSIANALHLSVAEAEKALVFWQGADLLQEDKEIAAAAPLERPKRLNTREIYQKSQSDPAIITLLQQAQAIFGEVISQSGCSILVSLYVNEHMSLEFLLTALTYLHLEGWTAREMRRAEQQLLRWKEAGIRTAADFDAYLKQKEQRRIWVKEVAEILHLPEEAFTNAERCKIAVWYENYKYTEPIISQAAVQAGSKANVNYINGILRRWHAKGYQQVRDVLAAETGLNVVGEQQSELKPEQDLLARRKNAVPKFTKDT